MWVRRWLSWKYIMKVFWWWEDDFIVGMVRFGFNVVYWYDFFFGEVLMFGWLGFYEFGFIFFVDYCVYIEFYLKKIVGFYGFNECE